VKLLAARIALGAVGGNKPGPDPGAGFASSFGKHGPGTATPVHRQP